MIEARNLRKTYGSQVAVDDLSFDVRPGLVTGFLGADGAGKSTTIRLMLGLAFGGGQTRFDGAPYHRLRQPMRTVGAVGDVRAFHPGRRARAHLRMLAAAQDITAARVEEVLDWVGLAEVADRRLRNYSMGMSQRLALGAALLGDPRVLILDEPTEGLDPAGTKWLRGFLRAFAAEGRIVFVAGNDVAALAQMADHLVVIEHGRLVADEPTAVFVGRHEVGELVLIRTPHLERLGRLLSATGARVRRAEDHQLAVAGLDLATVGDLAFRNGIVVHQLSTGMATLDTPFDDLSATAWAEPRIPAQSAPRRDWGDTGPLLSGDDTQTFSIADLFGGSGTKADQDAGGQYSGGQYSGGTPPGTGSRPMPGQSTGDRYFAWNEGETK
ncbi:MAG TPA: ATP-binding cassette domain-containing protein [Sporichthyaceae bacterium]|jgi:ABC-2 type transport system ATP-binding protein|nr:ATP-binding cassette domain-containing protein [Sporichthyaceae bacterium]